MPIIAGNKRNARREFFRAANVSARGAREPDSRQRLSRGTMSFDSENEEFP